MLYKTNHEFLTYIAENTKHTEDGGTTFEVEAIQVPMVLRTKGGEVREIVLNLPENFGDRVSKIEPDWTKVSKWVQDMLLYGVASSQRGTLHGSLSALLMGLKANYEYMTHYMRVATLVKVKEDAKEDKAIFCEYLALKNIFEGNIDAAIVFLQQIKTYLTEMMDQVGLGDDLSQKVVTTNVRADGTENSVEQDMNEDKYLKIVNYLRDKNEWAENMIRKFTVGSFEGVNGLCFYDRQHYLHSAMLIIYNKMVDMGLKGVERVGLDKAGLAAVKEKWGEREGEKADWESALVGIVANGVDEMLYENIDDLMMPDNCADYKAMREELKEGRFWDNYLPFGSNFFKEPADPNVLKINQSFESQAEFRSQVCNHINDIKRTMLWDLYPENKEDIEVMSVN
jgi:hypothetical protein